MHLIAAESLNNTSVHKHTSNFFNSIWVWTQCILHLPATHIRTIPFPYSLNLAA